ncbi:MAG TPA: hypothetical protein VG456_05375 [Candidatus Sulfopaludibacter sp.]|jgi:hypothetical protein|nr:hypothetical protein [Candidatus Sulfopaludibacter sp.]
MEVHAPHHPIVTWREFLVHLATVTVGILIALGLEQSVEAYHHRHLAEEARENILSEIRDNKAELDNHLADFAKHQQERTHGIEIVDQLLAHKHLSELQVGLGFSGPSLSSTSWSTASTVGALVYMDYGDVKRFAGAYKLQELFERLQEEQIGSVQTGVGMLRILDNGPDKVTDEELRAIKHQILGSSAGLQVMEQIARQLDSTYAKLLQKPGL